MSNSKAMTPAERLEKHRSSRRVKRVPLDGDVVDALATIQQREGLSSRSEAVRWLQQDRAAVVRSVVGACESVHGRIPVRLIRCYADEIDGGVNDANT